jgi:hypothetical protein
MSFLPSNITKQKKEEQKRREIYARIEQYALNCMSPSIRQCEGLEISVQEFQCGDPSCSPVDTAVTITFARGGGMFGIPNEAKDITEEELKTYFPTEEVIEAWSKGEKASWPPGVEYDEPDQDEPWDDGNDNVPEFPSVRFQVGTRVECRVGPDEWALGTIVLVWYREPHWPTHSWAPYQIKLDDGRFIFAPADMDQVIRSPISVEVESSTKSN